MTRKEYFQLLIDSAVDGTFPGTRKIYDLEKDFSTIEMTVCALRGENGTKCAVGLLIDDKDYDIRMESGDFISLANIPEGMTKQEIFSCQTCHDSAYNHTVSDSFSNAFYKLLKKHFPNDIEIVIVENNDIATGQSLPKILAKVK